MGNMEIKNNLGAAKGSAVSALLFTIYLDGVMEDYHALNQKAQLTRLKNKKSTSRDRRPTQIHPEPHTARINRRTEK